MRKSAADRRLVRRALRQFRDSVIAGRALAATEIEHGIVGEDRADVALCPGIGARWMAGDQVVDLEPILDGADTLLDRAITGLHHAFLSRSDSKRSSPRQATACCHGGLDDAKWRTQRRRRRRRRRSVRIARAALWPGAPVTPPPGCAPEPQ